MSSSLKTENTAKGLVATGDRCLNLRKLHDFDVQKDLHRRIRNDPDYDDWEYGTEPLPHEPWRDLQSETD